MKQRTELTTQEVKDILANFFHANRNQVRFEDPEGKDVRVFKAIIDVEHINLLVGDEE